MRIILTALRTLKRFRLYTIVNAIGLAVSLGCVILIARYVHQELTVNHFVKDLNRTYITAIEEANGQARYSGVVAGQSNLLADPLIEKTTTFFAFEEDHVLLEDHKIDIKVLAADSLFLQILPYPVAYGTHRMITPEDAIITGQLANQLFGNENPVGKTLTYSSGEELTIVGVLGEPSSKSFLDFDMLINKDQRHFQAYMPYDLVMLHKGSDVKQLNDRCSDYTQLPQMNESPLFTEWVFGRPVYDLEATTRIRRTGDADFQNVNLISISPAYFQMFGFQLKEGRLWDATDVEGQNKCILNESAQQLFGATDIRTTRLEMEHMIMREDPADDADNSYEVVGVIHDFQTGHLSKQTVPLVITYQAKGFHFDHLMARYGEGRKEDAIRYLEAIFQEVNSDADFTYSLLEESIDALYLEDRKVSRVYTLFALIAIFVSCLGLFALSLFDTRQRFREIALRKVNGAMTHDIMRLLLRRYVFLLGSAFVVAIPVTYMFIHRYLEAFAHKAPVSWWLFFVSAIVVAGVSMLTLFWQVKRAVRINPADILKSEQ